MSDGTLFGIKTVLDASWRDAVSRPLTRRDVEEGLRINAERADEELRNPRPLLVSPSMFNDWLAAGLIDKNGRFR